MSKDSNGAETLFARMTEKGIESEEEKSADEDRLAAMTEWLERKLSKLASRG